MMGDHISWRCNNRRTAVFRTGAPLSDFVITKTVGNVEDCKARTYAVGFGQDGREKSMECGRVHAKTFTTKQGNKVKSILCMGKAGSGKTTIIRECARVMSQRQNLWVVDTSNEICGDGDLVCAHRNGVHYDLCMVHASTC